MEFIGDFIEYKLGADVEIDKKLINEKTNEPFELSELEREVLKKFYSSN